MVNKYINWIKNNCWIIVGILLAVNMTYIYFSDKYYFYSSENVRYTIAKYKGSKYFIGKTSTMRYSFSYEVYGKNYNTYTEATLSKYNLAEDRLLIK